MLGIFIAVMVAVFFFLRARDNALNPLLWTFIGIGTYALASFGSLVVAGIVLWFLIDVNQSVADHDLEWNLYAGIMGLAATFFAYQQVDESGRRKRLYEKEEREARERVIVGRAYLGQHLQINLFDGKISRTGSRLKGQGSGLLVLKDDLHSRELVINSEIPFEGVKASFQESFTNTQVDVELEFTELEARARITVSEGDQQRVLEDVLHLKRAPLG